MQLESRLKDALDRIRAIDPTSVASGNSVGNSNRLESMMQQLLSAARTQATRLTKLETSCLRSPGAGIAMTTEAEEKVTAQKVALVGVLTALEQTKVELGEVLRSLGQRYLPAGEISIFPSAICLSLPAALCFFAFGFTFLNSATQITFHLQLFFTALTHSGHASSKRMRALPRRALLLNVQQLITQLVFVPNTFSTYSV